MDSDQNLSIAESSLTPELTELRSESSKRPRARTSPIWIHARDAVNQGEEEGVKYCRHCSGIAYEARVTTNFRLHLKAKHNIVAECRPNQVQSEAAQQLHNLYTRAAATGQASTIDNMAFRSYLNPEVINEALATLIVVRNLSFRALEWPELHAAFQAFNPEARDFLSTTHTQIPKVVDQLWHYHKDVLRRKLQSAISSIHLSLDIWTSPNRLLLLAICAHFVDRTGETQSKALLALKQVQNHSGDAQSDTVLSVLQDYGIVAKLGSIVSDNAATNDVLCRNIQERLDSEGIEWDSDRNRLRCIGHIINLAVQAFLFKNDRNLEAVAESAADPCNFDRTQSTFRSLGALGKLHNIVVHSRGSPARSNEFKASAGRLVPLDNQTRWNSWYEMLEVAETLKDAVDSYSKAHLDALRADYLTLDDWERLRQIKEFLKPFKRATMATQGDESSIDGALFNMDVLVEVFKRAQQQHANDIELASQIRIGWETFDKYYSKSDDSPLYVAALILHPNRRMAYLDANWPKKWSRKAATKVERLWIRYRDKTLMPEALIPEQASRRDRREPDMYDQITQGLSSYTRPASQDEYQDYSRGDPTDIGKAAALTWWLKDPQRKRYPRLSLMAIDILSIPAMSAEPERIFSGARRTISWERARIGFEQLEKLECLKHWKRSGTTEDV